MTRPGATWAAGVTVATGLMLGPPLLMVAAMTGGRSEVSQGSCGDLAQVSAAASSAESAKGMSPVQTRNAATIVAVGRRLGISQRGQAVALATASQESRFLNYANDGLGGDLSGDQRGIGRSLELPHEAVGSDHGSIGVFQQQWPWWGSMSELMDPAMSAVKFYEKLRLVPGWESMPITRAAQAVQRSAYPDAYADDEALAWQLLEQVGDIDISGTAAEAVDCSTTHVIDGPVTTPVSAQAAAASDRRNFGNSGGQWARGHTGTDYSLPCGTPVVAATAGRVIIDTDEAWAGRWLVQVSTGEAALTTWYAHMQRVTVAPGDVVRAGQQIGEVGTLGNSTGCHLHFEVHPRGGSIYEDPVDPSDWLSQHVGGQPPAPRTESVRAQRRSGAADFVLASFNVLGDAHTRPGRQRASYDSGIARMPRAMSLLEKYDVDVVGLQELQPPQRSWFLRSVSDRYGLYSPPEDTVVSIAWRRDRWALVSADSVPLRAWKGSVREMPLVRLRHLSTGAEAIFFSVHNAAGDGAAGYRAEATRRELGVMRDLTERYDIPAFLVGDLNARSDAFCQLTRGGVLSTPAGGSNGASCNPPRTNGIDWIFGNRLARWSGYTVDKSARTTGTSDHPLVVAKVGLGASS